VLQAIMTGLENAVPGVRCASVQDAGSRIVAEHGYAELAGASDRPTAGSASRAEILSEPSLKLMIRHPSVRPDAVLDALTGLGLDGFTAAVAGTAFVSVAAPGVSKASGLARLCAELGVGRDEVVAFGNARNDVAMLRWAGRGVAVANAVPEVLAAADEITASNDDDGVAQVIERLLAG
jgi:hydroxymethylpyrimidine pyrophosphatase-like HAD family hydrolase